MKENRAMRGESARPGKRPLRSLSITEKIEAIDRVHDGESKASVARDIGVPESTLRGWCKSEPKIRGMARNSSTPDSEAHSPASSSGANMTYSHNAAASHSSEDEGPAQKRMKPDLQLPVNHSMVENTESTEAKIDTKRYSDYQGLLAMSSYRPENSSLFLQQLGMLSANSNNYLPMSQTHPNVNAVGLVENGLQYTKSGIHNPGVNNKRHSISAIAPTQMDTVSKSAARKSLPPAAEAPATPLPASPNLQVPLAPIVSDKKNGVTNTKKVDEALWMWLLQQKTQLMGQQQSAQQTAQLCQDGSWFWQWYKQGGFTVPTTPVVQTSATRKSPSKTRAMLDSVLCNNNNENVKRSLNEELVEAQDIPSTAEEAIEHGEKFFKWLDKCSDPSVTRLQLMQFKFLLDNLKSCKKKRTSPGSKQSRK
ncbi:protein distal antenna [Belonocnema kinseyi]|uniref:protein distal antenna n=1 Tax=Belonocnema kinseyi TaxID=2817044 RepID=UPI00143D01F0|nr:protein distal antenna [Belonocnema kinseyi]